MRDVAGRHLLLAAAGFAGLLVLMGAAAQYGARLGQENVSLRNQVMAIKTSRAGECAWEPANATALPRRGAGGLARALPPQVPAALNSEKSVEPLGFLAQTVSIVARTLAALLMLGVLVAAYVSSQRIDSLPAPLQQRIRAHLRADSNEATESIAISKLVAYNIDSWFSTNPWSKTLALLYLTMGLIYCGGLGIYAVSGASLYDAFWQAVAGVGIDWTFTEEAEQGRGVGQYIVRLVAVAISVGGMLITALMLGIVSDAISDKIEDLKKGRSDVLEVQHTLILGWSDKLLPIIDQLCNANSSAGGRPIVVMAEREKEDMEEDISKHQIQLRGSRVICRTGNPLLAVDLEHVSAQAARSIIVLATADSADQSDARVLRVVLSVMAMHDRLKRENRGGLQGHIVAEVCDLDNEQLVRMVGLDRVETVVSHDMIGRLMLLCARQPGLAIVWESIIGFEETILQELLSKYGDEFYLKTWPELTGRRWSDVCIMFPLATPLGVKSHKTGVVMLNPADDYVLMAGDDVIVLAEDDDTYEPAQEPPPTEEGTCPELDLAQQAERVLFIGWRRDIADLIQVLDDFVAPGSELWLYNEVPIDARDRLLAREGLDPAQLRNLQLIYKEPQMEGDLVHRKRLEELKPESFTSILILADEAARMGLSGQLASLASQSSNTADSDSRSLASLLLLRDIQTQNMAKAKKQTRALTRNHPSTIWSDNLQVAVKQTVIISEILDSRTRHLIQDLQVSEYVLSNEMVSMALAMVSEDPAVNTILAELFAEQGNELYVHSAARYLRENETLNMYDITRRARQKREVVIGYKQRSAQLPEINPKCKGVRCLSLGMTEAFVVMASQS